jgi:hypothetical protein
METTHSSVEPVTMSEILDLDSWNQPRTSEDLQNFITRKKEELSLDEADNEDFL